MLTQIHIRDLATIEELTLNLVNGTTMITGETGAGKSVFIEAIEIALGGRASSNLIRPGKEKAEISLCFDITAFSQVVNKLKELDLDQDMDCIIRRIITSDGRSRCYVNGSPATVQLIKELGELLFHLHGQYDQQILLKADTQRDVLDKFADHLPLALQVKHLAETWKSCTQQIKNLQNKSQEKIERSHYLQFQLDELSQLNLKSDEWTQLEKEHKQLAHAEELLKNIHNALLPFSNEDDRNIISLLNEIRKNLENSQTVEPKSIGWLSTLNSNIISLQDLESDLQNYLEKTEINPEKLSAIEEKISQIFNLARKHKIQPEELYEYKIHLADQLDELNSSDDELRELENKRINIENEYQLYANKLSLSRKKAAQKLSKEMTETIRSLSLPHGEFSIELVNEIDKDNLSLYGNERILFLIKTNPDQSLQPLNKVISGGELSRLSLAAHLALAHQTSIPTLIFDEVDTGLSGATAEKIGKLLRKLGESYQVFCITHQAQVAACGHNHLLVEKYFVAKVTYTRLRILSLDEKTNEIARMLGGETITQKTLAHAEEILAQSS